MSSNVPPHRPAGLHRSEVSFTRPAAAAPVDVPGGAAAFGDPQVGSARVWHDMWWEALEAGRRHSHGGTDLSQAAGGG